MGREHFHFPLRLPLVCPVLFGDCVATSSLRPLQSHELGLYRLSYIISGCPTAVRRSLTGRRFTRSCFSTLMSLRFSTSSFHLSCLVVIGDTPFEQARVPPPSFPFAISSSFPSSSSLTMPYKLQQPAAPGRARQARHLQICQVVNGGDHEQ